MRDAQELTKLQADFMRAQMQAMTEQAKDLSETAAKALTERAKTPGTYGLRSGSTGRHVLPGSQPLQDAPSAASALEG